MIDAAVFNMPLDHYDIRIGQTQSCTQRGDLHRRTCAVAVGVVNQRTACLVVYHVIIGIHCLCPHPELARGQRAGRG